MCTDHRWHMHWRNPESTVEESLYDFRLFRPFVKDGVGFSNSYLVYFESFRNSLNQPIYKGYFQNADVKPYGRYFLKELVYSLAMMDAQRILIGAQPPGTWGREQETREFAKAYCALPALPFTDLQGMTDPITVRYRNTNGGTYVYVANLLWSHCSATLRLAPAASVRDLSTGKNSASAPDGGYEIRLQPYQLRSFLIGNGSVVPSKVAVSIPASVSEFYVRRLDALQASLAAVPASDARAGRFKARLGEIRRLLSAGQYAEAHRLVFSKLMNALTNEFPSLRNGQAASAE